MRYHVIPNGVFQHPNQLGRCGPATFASFSSVELRVRPSKLRRGRARGGRGHRAPSWRPLRKEYDVRTGGTPGVSCLGVMYAFDFSVKCQRETW
eukprot:1286791-Prymnesium_polylepis.1